MGKEVGKREKERKEGRKKRMQISSGSHLYIASWGEEQ